ncbi:MAG: hypothetical protein KC502_06905 [Myxococcales bacterium]|nr:hypothetical protein [Myxococcales bacterium]
MACVASVMGCAAVASGPNIDVAGDAGVSDDTVVADSADKFGDATALADAVRTADAASAMDTTASADQVASVDGAGDAGVDDSGVDDSGVDDSGVDDSGGGDAGGGDAGAAGNPDGLDAPDAATVILAPTSGGDWPLVVGGASLDAATWTDWSGTDAKAEAIFGPQGSHHVWVSVCMPKAVGDVAKVRVTLKLQDSGVKVLPGLMVLTTKLKPLAGHPGQHCRLAIPAFVYCPCTLEGYWMRVRAEVSKDKAVVSWSEVSVRLVVPPKTPCPKKGKSPCTTQLP